MGSTAITGELVWPSQNDLYGANVGGAAGDGVMHYEWQRRKLYGSVAKRNNYVISGGLLPASSGTLTITVPAGNAIIEGLFCEWPATNITLPASNTSRIYVKLVFAANLVAGLEIEDNTSGIAPAASTQLANAFTSGTAVTSTQDTRILAPGAVETITSGTSYTWPAGIYSIYVEVFGAGGGGGGGGEAGDTGGPFDGAPGSAGGTGGTTNFSAITANGGTGGGRGEGTLGSATGITGVKGTPGTGSGARTAAVTGKGMPGGGGGPGGQTNNQVSGGTGGEGGEGGYACGWLTGAPGDVTAYAIGAAGASGAGGNGSSTSAAGTAGQAGLAGRIVIHYTEQ